VPRSGTVQLVGGKPPSNAPRNPESEPWDRRESSTSSRGRRFPAGPRIVLLWKGAACRPVQQDRPVKPFYPQLSGGLRSAGRIDRGNRSVAGHHRIGGKVPEESGTSGPPQSAGALPLLSGMGKINVNPRFTSTPRSEPAHLN